MTAAEIAGSIGKARREGGNWRSCCPECGGNTLYLRDGHDRLLVYCWGGCPASAVLFELRKRGLLDDRIAETDPPPARPKPRPVDTPNVEPANRIWRETIDPRGALVERYVIGRGSALPPRAEEAIRFHPRCPFKGERVPAMVALLRDIQTNEPCGIHRTALLPDGDDRDRTRGKAMLGRAAGAAIKISPDDEVTLGIGITEGVETALAILCSGWHPVWATGSAGAIANFPILDGIEELTIFADCDPNGVGQRAAEQCSRRWIESGRPAAIQKVIG